MLNQNQHLDFGKILALIGNIAYFSITKKWLKYTHDLAELGKTP